MRKQSREGINQKNNSSPENCPRVSHMMLCELGVKCAPARKRGLNKPHIHTHRRADKQRLIPIITTRICGGKTETGGGRQTGEKKHSISLQIPPLHAEAQISFNSY